MLIKKIFFIVLVLTVCLALPIAGLVFIRDSTAEELAFLSVLGVLLAALATFLAVLAALYIAKNQAVEQRRQEEERRAHKKIIGIQKTLKYTMIIAASIRGRVDYQRALLDGSSWIALISNALVIEKRYEALFDFVIYEHLDSDLLDKFRVLEGSFFGITVAFNNSQDQYVLTKIQKVNYSKELAKLCDELKSFENDLYKAWAAAPQLNL